MIKDEYEILAFNDLQVAHAYLSTIYKVMTSLRDDFDARAEELESPYIGLYDFADKYKHRMDDISAIKELIEQARSKHRTVLAKLHDAEERIVELTESETRLREEVLSLTSVNEELRGNVEKIKEQVRVLRLI
jgi:chromosome segregation ATPase